MEKGVTDERLEEFREAFSVFDRDGDGVITSKELEIVMRSLGQEATDDELKEMIKQVDVDGNGFLDFDEFVAMMTRRRPDDDEDEKDDDDEMRQIFRQFDVDGNGVITVDELRGVMESLGQRMSDEEVEEMISEADEDGDGGINFEEFKRMMRGK